MSRLSLSWKTLPAVLAWSLLALQAVIPWTVRHYITQDGPSHLYTALITRDLILHPHGLYSSVYRLQPKLVTNWSTTLLLAALEPIVGAGHAEAALSTICVLMGFGCLTYFRRSLSISTEAAPSDSSALGSPTPVYDPLTNFLTHTWFLWIGFYNFYFGMALCLLLVGFYIRHSRAFTTKRAATLGIGLVVLFFAHVLPAGLALMAIVLVFTWEYFRGHDPAWPPLLASLVPTVLLMGFFVRKSFVNAPYVAQIAWAWSSFPMHVFASATGRAAEEALLVPAMMLFMGAGLLALRRREWGSVRLPLVVVALLIFAGYLFVPDSGFGGSAIKIRLSWAVFVFGCSVVASGEQIRALRTPISIYIACFVAASLIVTTRIVHHVGRAADTYESALEQIPEGSTIARMHYSTKGTRQQFDFDNIDSDPLLHADAWMTSRRRLIDLTDYQAPSRVFPVTFQKTFSGDQQKWLYQLEGGEIAGFAPLGHVLEGLPVPLNYIVLVGDEGSDVVRSSDFTQTTAWLDANMHPVSRDDFVRVYRTR